VVRGGFGAGIDASTGLWPPSPAYDEVQPASAGLLPPIIVAPPEGHCPPAIPARLRHPGPRIIYIGHQPTVDGPRVIYGTD
jgi:hypothetical protein